MYYDGDSVDLSNATNSILIGKVAYDTRYPEYKYITLPRYVYASLKVENYTPFPTCRID